MHELDIIAESLNTLPQLAKKDIIFLDDVQAEFRPDLQNFIMGATLSIRDGKIVVGKNLYKEWLMKLKTSGFDYEIDFKK